VAVEQFAVEGVAGLGGELELGELSQDGERLGLYAGGE
jgi:hypothetical protein